VDDPDYAHVFRMRDPHGHVFLDHGGIWLLELSKFAADAVETEQQRWLKFFKEAECLDENALPAWMQTQEMRRAMNTLKAFSEKEHAYHAYHAYQARQARRDSDLGPSSILGSAENPVGIPGS